MIEVDRKPVLSELNERVRDGAAWVELLRSEVGKVVVGQKGVLDRLLVGLLTNGHILLEGVPGLAKTLLVKTLANVLQINFQRIQFTPDLLPADIVGTLIYNPAEGRFATKKGPVFSNIVLADEINRSPAKVQSALLESMQERQVTIGDTTYPLDDPFLVLATQNPIEQEGTYQLPEAQLDRFLLKISVDYPTKQEERAILDAMAFSSPSLKASPILTKDVICDSRKLVDDIYMDEKIRDYIVSLVFATRYPADNGLPFKDLISYGASPRATISLALASKAWAFLKGRGYVVPQDVKSISRDVFRHRIGVTYEAEAEGITSEDIVEKLLETVPVP